MLSIRRVIAMSAVLAVSSGGAWAFAKDNSRLGDIDPPSVVAENETPLPAPEQDQPAAGEDQQAPDEVTPDDPAPDSEDDLNLGEIPDLKSVELTTDMAKRALDTYLVVRDKYKDADLESYDDLQEFVDKNERGKEFEADIKAAGFATVDEWNVAITTLGFAYSAAADDPTADIMQQISEIESDQTIAQDLKDRMIASLKAMIPSDNNKKVVAELLADTAYKDKLAQLDAAEGGEGE